MFKSEGQIYIFAAFVFCGVATGLWHWLSHLCCPCGAKKWKIFVCDAVFAAGFAFLLFVFLFRKRNSAEMVLFFGAWTGIFCLRENSRRAA